MTLSALADGAINPSLAYNTALNRIFAEDAQVSHTDVTVAIGHLAHRTGWSEVAVAHRVLLNLRTARLRTPATSVWEILVKLEEQWKP